jgi:hypothetical protein
MLFIRHASAPLLDLVEWVISENRQKSPVKAMRGIAKSKKAPLGGASRENDDFAALAPEKQPQQDDHRYRHAQQPEQNSASHVRLHEFLM